MRDPSPAAFLIDPVSQTIKKKYLHNDIDGPRFFDTCKILAMKNRVFFVRDDVAGIEITLVVGSSPDQFIRRFRLNLPPVRCMIAHPRRGTSTYA